MRMTSLRVPTSASVVLAMLLAAPLAFADKNDDLYKKGQAAVNSGDSIAARDAFCALPKDYQDADAQCKTYTDAATRTLNRYHLNFAQGMTALQGGDFATAEEKFRNVKAGPDAETAKQKLADIPRLKQQAADAANAANASAALEGQMKQKLEQGTGAFNAGDYNTAKSVLNQVTGSHQGEAKAVLDKIRTYENAITQGNTFFANKDYASARSAYQQAMAVNPTGPSNATDLYTKAVTAGATAASVPANPVPNNNVVKPPQPKPQIDVATYISDGNKAMQKKQYAKARNFFNAVIAQDKNNQEAHDGLAQISQLDTTQGNASEADDTLRDIISAYYSGSRDAEDRFKTYVYAKQGKKLGLARFYAGASMMTRYYLTGGTDQDLKRQAQDMFKAAKTVDGFKAPKDFISPKIMKVFEEAS